MPTARRPTGSILEHVNRPALLHVLRLPRALLGPAFWRLRVENQQPALGLPQAVHVPEKLVQAVGPAPFVVLELELAHVVPFGVPGDDVGVAPSVGVFSLRMPTRLPCSSPRPFLPALPRLLSADIKRLC